MLFENENTAKFHLLKKLLPGIVTKACPVYKTPCRGADCMSFYAGQVGKAIDNKFRVYPPTCNCAIVTGIITTEEA